MFRLLFGLARLRNLSSASRRGPGAVLTLMARSAAHRALAKAMR